MYEQPTPFQNFWRNTTPTQKFAIFLIPVAIIVVIIISIILTNHLGIEDPDSHHIDITNYSIIDAPEKYKPVLQKQVWDVLTYADPPLNTTINATIRGDSFSETSDETFSYANFLLDIPDLKQTYDVSFTYLNQGINNTEYGEDYVIDITCPVYTETAYKDSTCIISNDPYSAISQYLPYSGTTPSGIDFSIELETQDNNEYDIISSTPADNGKTLNIGDDFLWVSTNTCNDQNLTNEVKSYLQTWLKTRLANPSDFTFKYYSYCESDTLDF